MIQREDRLLWLMVWGCICDLMDLCIYIDCNDGWGCMEEEESSHYGIQKRNLTEKGQEYIYIYQSTLFQSLPLRKLMTKTQAGTKKLLRGPHLASGSII